MASGQHVPAVNMAEEILEAVEKLQLRLGENSEPRKVRTPLRRDEETVYVSDNCASTSPHLLRLRYKHFCPKDRILSRNVRKQAYVASVASYRQIGGCLDEKVLSWLCLGPIFFPKPRSGVNYIESFSSNLVLSYQK